MKKEYKCNFCKYTCGHTVKIKHHTTTEHLNQMVEEIYKDNFKFHKCKFCQEEFKNKELSKKHLVKNHLDKLYTSIGEEWNLNLLN